MQFVLNQAIIALVNITLGNVLSEYIKPFDWSTVRQSILLVDKTLGNALSISSHLIGLSKPGIYIISVYQHFITYAVSRNDRKKRSLVNTQILQFIIIIITHSI